MGQMTLTASNPPLRSANLFGGALLGATLVTVGLIADYLTIATPFVSTLVPAHADRGSVGIALGVWSFTLIAGGALLLAGTSRLARVVAILRRPSSFGGPAARAFASASDEVVVASDVALGNGPAIPELVIGAFG